MSKWDFKKFMDDIVKRENKPQAQSNQDTQTPQQKYNELYREKWQNRIKWTKK